jgi:beta-galactosidase
MFHLKGLSLIGCILCVFSVSAQNNVRTKTDFDNGWRFKLDSVNEYNGSDVNDANWRTLNLPHDWSIEFPFDSASPSGVSGGALRGGLAWYRKTFTLPESNKEKIISIAFDGVYRNSEVWINGHSLGMRPSGYISFQYDLTPYLNYGNKENVIAVKVDNLKQPNSRWYSGSGIYRNVWLVKTNKIHIVHWGTYVTTPRVNKDSAFVMLQIYVCNSSNNTGEKKSFQVKTKIYNSKGIQVAVSVEPKDNDFELGKDTTFNVEGFTMRNPDLWSVEHPYLYKAVTQIIINKEVVDEYTTSFGIRNFKFDSKYGFILNGKPLKILGVCDHHDLGALGTAINKRALQRQLQMLKAMGCNGIRTSHNPPAPELLDLADKLGFVVMDEAFDMWAKPKTRYDYHLDWKEWHRKDLEDQILRDRNHPSVIIWSVGNEIPEQGGNAAKGDTTGRVIGRELVSIVKSLDATREIVTANNNPNNHNNIILSGAFDLIGVNYHQQGWEKFHDIWPDKKMIVTESTSALETRGYYDLIPSDSIRRWPQRWDKTFRNPAGGYNVSAYDNVSTPWGSTHEESIKALLKSDLVSGMFIWTGFDYIGEPTPYGWPARSSYFGIIDLAGFPKDVYYLYQSIFTDKPVLHIYPHWNWKNGDTVDVVGYYNNADEVELFLNGKSLGTRKKSSDDLHVMWRVPYVPGTLKAVSRKDDKTVLTKEIKTAGAPAKLILNADRKIIDADGKDLSYVTVTIVDKNGITVPDADNLIQFEITGAGFIAGVDNGSETSHESFKANKHTAMNGLALAILQSNGERGKITLIASSQGLGSSKITVEAK